MTTKIFLIILFTHFVADFVLQTDKQARGKGDGMGFYNKHLFNHVGVYSLTWCIVLLLFFGFNSTLDPLLFVLITFVCHYITDWCTSRLSKPLFKKGDYHNGFVVVGFDQVLHYLQLYFTFQFLV